MLRQVTTAGVLLLVGLISLEHVNGNDGYGVDCSFPIHSFDLKCGNMLGDRQSFYEDFMEGCRQAYGKKGKICDSTETDRLAMSVRQPQSMVNYTNTGFKKIRAPEEVMQLLYKHWELNKDLKTREQWPTGNTYVNHWQSPTYMVSVEDTKLRGASGIKLKNMIWDAAKDTIEQWTGMELKPCSMYGIRIYTEGAVLNPHVDRLPLVSSAIVNVAQDVDEPWPLEVYDRQGNAVNVTMEPGDMVLYESGSLIHGRPFPLKGRYYANIFIHFEPTGRKLGDETDDFASELDEFLPPYILQESPEVQNWASRNPYGWKKQSPSAAHVDTLSAHRAAYDGDVEKLAKIYFKNKKSLTARDRNGWQPIHEAARMGQTDALEMLLNFGADINAKTYAGNTPLNVAKAHLEEGELHPAAQYLMGLGATDDGDSEL